MISNKKEEARQLREALKSEERKKAIKAKWQANLEKTSELCAEAKEVWENSKMDARVVWLLVGIFEEEQRSHLKGSQQYCKSVWFDKIAPRADGKVAPWGVSGFTSRMAKTAPSLINLSGNGYVYLTGLGYALAQYLRATYENLTPVIDKEFAVIQLGEWGVLPSPTWRKWK